MMCYACKRSGRIGNHKVVVSQMVTSDSGVLFSSGNVCRTDAQRIIEVIKRELEQIQSDAEHDRKIVVAAPE